MSGTYDEFRTAAERWDRARPPFEAEERGRRVGRAAAPWGAFAVPPTSEGEAPSDPSRDR